MAERSLWYHFVLLLILYNKKSEVVMCVYVCIFCASVMRDLIERLDPPICFSLFQPCMRQDSPEKQNQWDLSEELAHPVKEAARAQDLRLASWRTDV